jgi:hypothetical protein
VFSDSKSKKKTKKRSIQLTTCEILEMHSMAGQVVWALLGASTTHAAIVGKVYTVATWPNNPSELPAFQVYTPTNIAEKPAIVLGVSEYKP